jgi:hypothetical protein
MAEADNQQGDPDLIRLFEQFEGRLVSPGGAAALLGLSRKTIYTLGKREVIRVFHSSENRKLVDPGPRWTYIPLDDLEAYAERVGRPFPKRPFGM